LSLNLTWNYGKQCRVELHFGKINFNGPGYTRVCWHASSGGYRSYNRLQTFWISQVHWLKRRFRRKYLLPFSGKLNYVHVKAEVIRSGLETEKRLYACFIVCRSWVEISVQKKNYPEWNILSWPSLTADSFQNNSKKKATSSLLILPDDAFIMRDVENIR